MGTREWKPQEDIIVNYDVWGGTLWAGKFRAGKISSEFALNKEFGFDGWKETRIYGYTILSKTLKASVLLAWAAKIDSDYSRIAIQNAQWGLHPLIDVAQGCDFSDDMLFFYTSPDFIGA
jgi:hypothetical protein